ncbi:MAG TPA: hypothetical protein VLI05_06475 [Candidatus Saccharimonadia bacterium]|nr:hypothetical protein [Candidatus Saccharimonadia bacterium]
MNYEHHSPHHGDKPDFQGADAYRDLTANTSETNQEDLTALTHEFAAIQLKLKPSDAEKTRAVALLRQFRQEGAPAAHAVLQELSQGRLIPELSASLVNAAATRENVPEIADYVVQQGKMEQPLRVALARLGDDQLLPHLAAYASHAIATEPDPEYRSYKMNDALFVASAIEHRATSEASREQWQQHVEGWLDEYVKGVRHRGQRAEALNYFRTISRPEVLALAYAQEFFNDSVNDPDFGQSLRRKPDLMVSSQGSGKRSETLQNLWVLMERPLSSHTPEQFKERLIIAAYQEDNPSPYSTTLGIEVEIEEESLLVDDNLNLSSEEREARAYQRQANYRHSEQLGIPAGSDAMWEFAPRPAYSYLTHTREVQALMQADLLRNEYSYPLHLTGAEVSTNGPAGNEVYTLLHGLEATGWSCSAERLEQASTAPEGGWACKGNGGIMERSSEDIQGDASTAVELRTLEAKGLSGLNRTMRSASALFSALKAHTQLLEHPKEAADPSKTELAAAWQQYSAQMNDLFASHQMTRPSDDPWAARFSAGKGLALSPDFLTLADLLRSAEQGEDRGRQFQQAAQDIVLQTRRRVMAVLDRTRPHLNQAA